MLPCRGLVHCREPIEVLSYKIGVCKAARYVLYLVLGS